MTNAVNLLTLHILRTTPHETSGFTTHLTLDGQTIGPVRSITEADLGTLRHVVDGCRHLLKSPGSPALADDALLATGIELFHLWLAPQWETCQQRLLPGKPTLLALLTNVPELLHFPWETLRLPNDIILGIHPQFAIQRRIHGLPIKNHCRAISPGPLRILFMASAPTDFHAPPIQQEIEAFQTALLATDDPFAPRIDIRILSTGRQTELAQAIHQFQPHVVHLCGPVLIRGSSGFFAFEETDGLADVRTATEIGSDLLKHAGIGLLVLSGRESNKAPPIAATGILCQELLTSQTVSMALAWPESLTAPESIPFLRTFYTELAQGVAVDFALTQARKVLQPLISTQGRIGWILAAMYAQGEHPFLFNAAFMLSSHTKTVAY